MDRMKRFLDIYVPTEICNFCCTYCYVSQSGNANNLIGKIGHSVDEIRSALSRKRLGGVCFLNFCGGGETLLGEEILPIIKELLKEGHYVQIVTNGVLTNRINEIVSWDKELVERIFLKLSFHYMELKKRNLLAVFFENVSLIKNSGASFTLELMPHDELIPYIDEIKAICMERVKALPHITVGRDETSRDLKLLSQYSEDEYQNIWGTFDSEMFNYKMKMFGEERHEFCYAGEWSCSIRLDTGDLYQCNGSKCIDNIYENIESPLHFLPVGRQCPNAHCYNCHAYMTMGIFPELEAPTYAEMRDRICADGTHWLSSKMHDFFNQKFQENNIVYSSKKKKRVLLIGDSICEGYRDEVKKILSNVCEVYSLEENAKFTTYTLRMLQDWAENLQIGTDIDVVYWNNGLWDIVRLCGEESLISQADYKNNLHKIIKRIHYLFPNAKVVFATTTPVLEISYDDVAYVRKNSDICLYNDIAKMVMNEEDIYVDDLYKIVQEMSQEIYLDGTHFSQQGNVYLANHIANYLFDILSNRFILDVDRTYSLNDIKSIREKSWIIYGYGNYGKYIKKKLDENRISIFAIADSNKNEICQFNETIIDFNKVIEFCKVEKNIGIIIAINNIEEYRKVREKILDEVDIDIYHYSIVDWVVT